MARAGTQRLSADAEGSRNSPLFQLGSDGRRMQSRLADFGRQRASDDVFIPAGGRDEHAQAIAQGIS
jgi:hypothetical protein